MITSEEEDREVREEDMEVREEVRERREKRRTSTAILEVSGRQRSQLSLCFFPPERPL